MIFRGKFLRGVLIALLFTFFGFGFFLNSFVEAEESTESATIDDSQEASASGGQSLKQENSESTQIETSEALASVNLLNLSNTNISSSSFEFLVTNFVEGEKELAETKVVISESQEEINLENNIEVLASTGRNQIKGVEEEKEIIIETGEATALANVINIVNTNISNSEFFFEVVNILSPTENDLILPYPEKLKSSIISFQNKDENREIEIVNHLEAQALTGANKEINNAGDNTIITGEAQAQTNNFSLANLDFYRHDYSFLVVNDLGNWTGEVKGELLPEIIEETVEIESQREEDSTPEKKIILKNNIQVLALTGENEIYENQGKSLIQTGEARSLVNLFNLVNLNILESRFFIWVVNVLDNWSGDIIFASSGEEPPEEKKKESEEKIDQRQPKLEIFVKNNVGEFVYPGDTITFEVMVSNVGEAAAYKTRLTQKLLSEVFGDFGTAEFDLETIEPGKSGRLSFGLKLIDNGELLPGLYETRAMAKGFAPNGYEVISNEVKTSFIIKNKKRLLSAEVKAKTEEKEILGSAVMISPPRRKSIYPYLLLAFLILLYLSIKFLKRKRYLS